MFSMDRVIVDCGANSKCTDNSKAIQMTVDEVFSSGGGKVVVPQGVFRSGTIVLKDNVELYLEEGAVLKATDDLSLLSLSEEKREDGLSVPSYQNCDYDGKPKLFFLYCHTAKNVRITGKGTIDGNEEIFFGYQDRYFIDGAFYPRMPLLYLEDVFNLTIEGVTLSHSAFWTVHMVGCRYVFIDHVRIRNNLKLANCDGIDPDHCQNVEIKDCDIECADDAIVFKNTLANQKYGNLEKIHVSGCTLKSTSAAIKFGTESYGRFHDIHVEKCRIYDTNRGISFQLRDKGEIDHCLFENLSISTRCFAKPYYWGYGEPICITALPRTEDNGISSVHDISFRNIMIDSENGIMIYGEKKGMIHDVSFENVSMNLHRKSKWPIDKKDLRPYDRMPFIEGCKPDVVFVRGALNVIFTNFMDMVAYDYSDAIGKRVSIEDSEQVQLD